MFKVASKIKKCRLALLQWSRQQQVNMAKEIQRIKGEMDRMKEHWGQRDWNGWNLLRGELHEAYKEDEAYWCQKSRIQWLKEGDKNTKYFHASTIQRRKANHIGLLEKESGGWCQNGEEVVEEISAFYSNLFTSSDRGGWEDKLDGISTSVSDSMNSNLIKPVEACEIRTALFSMNSCTAPGLDGMTPLFFSNFLAHCTK